MRRLIIRPGAIGDVIVSLPALQALSADYTEVWVPSPVTPLIRFVDSVRSIASTGLDLLELGLAPASLWQTLASFDSIVSWYGANRPEFQAAVRGLPVTFFPALPPDNRLHATDFYLTQVGAPLGAKPRIPISSRPSGIVAIHPFSGSAKKNWPLESFADLAQTLNAEWCEGPQPLQYRFTDMGKLAEWLASASVYIGNDSGITHLAAAVGTPVVALFGPTDPRVWAPRADPLRLVTANPLDNLTVAEVIAAANQIRRIS